MKSPFVNQDYYLSSSDINDRSLLFKWNEEMYDVYSPVCENGKRIVIGKHPLMSKSTVLEILDSAVKAYDNGRGEWPTSTVSKRIECVSKFRDMMKERREEIVNLLMWEICKRRIDAESEFDRTIQYITETINALVDLDRNSSKFISDSGVIAQIRRSPFGVCLCMAPFNYPLNETFTTLIPALIMGNTIIFKPAKFGVLLFAPLLECFETCFPKGVVNSIYGDGKTIIEPLMSSGKIDVLAFIGTSKVADILKRQHPKPHRLKSILGLDAKNIGIVTETADIKNAVKECLLGTLTFNGQRCTALKLLYVKRSIAKPFTDAFVEEVLKLRMGLPWEEGVNITPLPEDGKCEYLMSLIKDAVGFGAKALCGGWCITKNNLNSLHPYSENMPTLFTPVVLTYVNKHMRIFHEEQFGPVVPIVYYDDIEEPINAVVESNFGQQVSIFSTENPEQLGKLIDIFTNQVSRVNINCQCQRGPDSFPFNGRKDSAEGTLSISDALKAFSIRSIVATKEATKYVFSDIIKQNTSNFLNTNFIL
jgi:acyl-CoA reductase-like NAD-dependent aldehyde dehydrogenase